MKIFYSFIIVIVEGVIMAAITNYIDRYVDLHINVTIIVGLLVMLITAVIFMLVFAIKKEKLSSELDKYKKLYEDKKELNENKTKIIEELSAQKVGIKDSPGGNLLLMSLSQPLHEPLKIGLLKKAYEEYNNILAALMLANIYYSGIEYNGKCYIEKDLEKAADIYFKIKDADTYGVSYWQLGWMYENNYIKLAKQWTKEERYEQAKEFYDESSKRGYPKAYNSIGKFYLYGWGGLDKNNLECNRYYLNAAEGGDVYGIMNCGHVYMNAYYADKKSVHNLDMAEEYYTKAAQMKNAEGYLNLGIVYEIRAEINSGNIDLLHKSKEYYTKALSDVRNQYSATAYYRLGKLINNNPTFNSDQFIINALGKCQYADLAIECFTRSYLIFQDVRNNNDKLDGKHLKCFEELTDIFKKIV